jgi:hypothetical protein
MQCRIFFFSLRITSHHHPARKQAAAIIARHRRLNKIFTKYFSLSFSEFTL